MVSARVRTLPAARALALEGDEDNGGAFTFGGGGNVVAPLEAGDSTMGESTPVFAASSISGDGPFRAPSLRGRLREFISVLFVSSCMVLFQRILTIYCAVDLHRSSITNQHILPPQHAVFLCLTGDDGAVVIRDRLRLP